AHAPSSGPQAVAVKDVTLVASSGDGLAWPAILGGAALFLGLAMLLLARRAPKATGRARR
ncbi:MAG: hypothetical protein J2P43_14755, partial [Candidatus Dormibacteraeota bacterium]|nr:hypothetical protein [Candidatus Dormibacteraeota bacterium]